MRLLVHRESMTIVPFDECRVITLSDELLERLRNGDSWYALIEEAVDSECSED